MIDKLTPEEIEEVLSENVLGRIGCHDGRRTYVVPVNYVYDGRFIIAHSREGMKIDMMRKNPEICFEVDEMRSFTRWKSVIAWGQYQELTDERDRYYAMKLFVDKMLRLKMNAAAAVPQEVVSSTHPNMGMNKKPIVYRIVVSEKTGRFEND